MDKIKHNRNITLKLQVHFIFIMLLVTESILGFRFSIQHCLYFSHSAIIFCECPIKFCNFCFTQYAYCIPRQSRGHFGFSLVMPPHGFFSGRDNSKTIYLRPFKFVMWVHMGADPMPIVLWPWPSRNRPIKTT